MRKNAPFVARTDDAEYCCPGRVTVPVEYLDRYQSIPYGTTAWKKSYGRRNQIENLNGILRNKGSLDDRWCHALGNSARFIGSVMLGVAHLLRETKQAWLNANANGNSEDAIDPGPPAMQPTPSRPTTNRRPTPKSRTSLNAPETGLPNPYGLPRLNRRPKSRAVGFIAL